MGKSHAYNVGYRAYWLGKLPTDNPYIPGTQSFVDWANGYRTSNYEAAN